MARDGGKISKDLERLNRRIQESKRLLRQAEIKTEDLEAAIHKTIEERKRKPRK